MGAEGELDEDKSDEGGQTKRIVGDEVTGQVNEMKYLCVMISSGSRIEK